MNIGIINSSQNNVVIGADAILNDGNTVAWYKSDEAATITKDGSNLVSRWNDFLGSGHDLIQATSTKNPLWRATGILFDGIDDSMATEAFTLIKPEIIYIVFKQITWVSNDYIFDGNTLTGGGLRQRTATPGLGITAGASSSADNALALDTWGIARVVFNTVSYLQINENAITISGNYGTNNMNGFTLGTLGGGTATGSNIEVKEIVIRKVEDSSENQSVIYNYLKAKYSL